MQLHVQASTAPLTQPLCNINL